MPDPMDELDTQILDEIRGLYEATDPVPPELTDRLKFALTVQALHADVAELTHVPQAAVRSDGPDSDRSDRAEMAQTVTFTSGTLSLMVSLADSTADGVSVDGWVTRGGARVELQVENQVLRTTADEHGRFVFENAPRGPGNFVVWANPDQPDDRPVVTPTIEL